MTLVNFGYVLAKDSPSKVGLKPFLADVNRRATYNTSDKHPVVETDAIFDVFGGEERELVAVRTHNKLIYSFHVAVLI